MIPLQLEETAALKLALVALKDIREHAAWVRLYNQPATLRSSPEARAAIVRIAGRQSAEFKPLLKACVNKFGAEIFRRKSGGAK